jgi:hypothetical protein
MLGDPKVEVDVVAEGGGDDGGTPCGLWKIERNRMVNTDCLASKMFADARVCAVLKYSGS